jgi:autotransporter-associated beta strand protein
MNARRSSARTISVVLGLVLLGVKPPPVALGQIPLGSAAFSTYPDGALVGTSGWQQYLSPSTNPLQVNAGAVSWSGGAASADHQDAMLPFEQLVMPPLSGTSVITYDLLMNVASANAGTPSYFAALNALTDNAATNNFQNARLAVTASGTGFLFGARVNGQAGYPYRFGTTVLSLNQDYALRAEIHQVAGNANDLIKLYVGPNFSTLSLYATAGYSSGAVTDPTYGAMLLSQFSGVNAVGSTLSVKSLAASYSPTAQPATSRVWSGGDGTWTVDAENWTGDAGPAWSSVSGSTHVATLSVPAVKLSVSEPVTAHALAFHEPGMVEGQSVTLAANRGAVPFIATTAGVVGSVSSEIAGSNGMMKTGRGTLQLSGSSTYTGVTSIAAGTLQLSGGPNRLAAGGTLSFTGANTQLDVTTTSQSFSAMTFLTPVSGTANVTISGVGGSVQISGTADFEVGPLNCTVAGVANSLSMANLSSFEYDNPSGAFRIGLKQTSTNSAAAGTSSVVLARDNLITAKTLAVADVWANNNGGGGQLLLGDSNFFRVGSVVQGSGRSDSDLRFQSDLASPSLMIRGTSGSESAGTWLVGSNWQFGTASKRQFTATTDLSGGQIDVRVDNLIIGQASCVLPGRGGTVDSMFVMGSGTLDAGTITIGRITGGGTNGVVSTFAAYGSLVIDREDAVVTATNVFLAENSITGTGAADRIVSGTINLSAGTLMAGNLARGEQTGRANVVKTTFLWTGGTIGNLPGADLVISSLPLTVASGSGTFNADRASIYVDAASPLTGEGALIKIGNGTLTLTASNSFKGAMHVAAGTLSLAGLGSLASQSVTVAAGAFLRFADLTSGTYVVPSTQAVGGAGEVVGRLTIGTGATLSPGTGIGFLTFSDDLLLAAGGNYNWQTGALTETGQDVVAVGGRLVIDATADDPFRINLETLSGVTSTTIGPLAGFKRTQNYSWRLARASGGIDGFSADKFRIVSSPSSQAAGFVNDLGGGAFSVAQSGNELQLIYTAAMFEVNVTSGTLSQDEAGFETFTGSLSALKTGSGTLVLDQPNSITGSFVVESGRLHITGSRSLAASLVEPLAGGILSLAPHLHTTVAGLSPLAGGLTDVGTGKMTVASGLTSQDVKAAVVAGRGTGSWNGQAGITSSAAAAHLAGGTLRAIGWTENDDSSLTIGFAAPGDTNLDGIIDTIDIQSLLERGLFGESTADARWQDGDFNYDGAFDILDIMAFVSTGLYDAGPYMSMANQHQPVDFVAVPEPAGTVVLLAGSSIAFVLCLRQGGRSSSRGLQANSFGPRKRLGPANRVVDEPPPQAYPTTPCGSSRDWGLAKVCQ